MPRHAEGDEALGLHGGRVDYVSVAVATPNRPQLVVNHMMPNLNLEPCAKCSVFSIVGRRTHLYSVSYSFPMTMTMTTARPIDSACVTPSFLPPMAASHYSTRSLAH